MYPKPAIGDTVTFDWDPTGERLTGVVVDKVQFQPGRSRYGVAVTRPTIIDPDGCPPNGRIYDVWPEYFVR